MPSVDVDFYPLIVAMCFYLSVFLIAELTRNVLEKYGAAGSLQLYFLMEVIATAQMCTCVYENAVIIRHYGVLGFFFIVALLIFSGSIMNREAYVSPLAPIELYFKGRLSLLNCELTYKVPFVFVPSFEVFGCFLMRYILCRIPANLKKFLGPTVVSSLLTFALLFVGVPGLNPTIASSRLYGCDGLNTVWFILTYWICPVVGWMLSSFIDDLRITNAGKKAE